MYFFPLWIRFFFFRFFETIHIYSIRKSASHKMKDMPSTVQPSLTCDLFRKWFYCALKLYHHHHHHYCIAAHVTSICCLLLMIKWTKGIFSTTLEKFCQSQNCCWLSIPFLRIFSEILLIILIMMDIISLSIFSLFKFWCLSSFCLFHISSSDIQA